MRITIMCGIYYPNYSAVGLCASRIAEQLSEEHEVTVLSIADGLIDSNELFHNNVKVYKDLPRIEAWKTKMLNRYNGNKSICCFIKYFSKIWRMISVVLYKYSVRVDYIDSFRRMLALIPSNQDLIIPFCMPIESLVAAVEYRDSHPETILSAMIYDGFADARTTHYFAWNRRLKYNRHVKLERFLFDNCEKVFCLEQNYEHFINSHEDIRDKFVIVEHPCIIRQNQPFCKAKRQERNSITFIYGGGLKKGYIDPSYFVELIKPLPQYNLQIYTSNNAMDHFKYLNAYEGVEVRGWVTQDRMREIQQTADFLINFATVDGHQVSSKIFNYISMGRPFIHVYYTEQDGNLKYLSRYPLALCINANESMELNRKMLVDFCNKNKKSEVNFEEVERRFYDCTPKYICEKMIGDIYDGRI